MAKHKNKNKITNKNDENLFREMSYELAGDIGAIDNEEMKKNEKLMNDKKTKKKRK